MLSFRNMLSFARRGLFILETRYDRDWEAAMTWRRSAVAIVLPGPLPVQLVVTGALVLSMWLGFGAGAIAQDDARTRQLRLLCAQLSGDLTDPGGMAAFRRCLTTHDPLGEIRRDNNIGGGAPAVVADRPGARPPKGFGRDSRRSLADGVQRFATHDGRLFYAIDKDGKLWRWDSATKDARVVDTNVAGFEVVDDAHLLVLGADARLWQEAGIVAGRTLIDEQVAAFQPIGAVVFVRGNDSKLWRETGNASNRTLVDQQVAAFQAIDTSRVYVEGNDGKLWRENGDARDRTEVAGTVAAFQYVPDGDTIYVLGRDGSLWRQAGGSGKPELVDRSIAAFQAVDMHLAYVLAGDGRLWQELGNRDQSVLVDSGVLSTAGRAAFLATDAQHLYVLGNDHKLWAETMPGGR
jgi:hypothetical protein